MSENIDLSELRDQYREVDYFYRVNEFVTTFGKDEGENDSFSHDEDFRDKDLLKAREEASAYFNERLKGLEGGKYFLPFASPEDFIESENAAFSIALYFVVVYANGEQDELCLSDSEEEETVVENRQKEQRVLEEKGFI